jgi:hypothetical protein
MTSPYKQKKKGKKYEDSCFSTFGVGTREAAGGTNTNILVV